jgi:hypothetical protein
MAQIETGDWMQQWSKIVDKAWHDDGYKDRLKRDPRSVLKEEGLEIPQDVEIKLVEDTPSVVHLTLPAKIAADISENDLETVAGGAKIGGIWWGGSSVRFSSALTINQSLISSLLRFNR